MPSIIVHKKRFRSTRATSVWEDIARLTRRCSRSGLALSKRNSSLEVICATNLGARWCDRQWCGRRRWSRIRGLGRGFGRRLLCNWLSRSAMECSTCICYRMIPLERGKRCPSNCIIHLHEIIKRKCLLKISYILGPIGIVCIHDIFQSLRNEFVLVLVFCRGHHIDETE